MSGRSLRDEITAAAIGGVVVGGGWLTSGAPGHPALLFVCGFPVGMIFGFRVLRLYDDSGAWGRGLVIGASLVIGMGVALLGVRRATGWW